MTQWWYKDLSDHVQGPFPAETMLAWIAAGWFSDSLQVARMATGPFQPLSEDSELKKYPYTSHNDATSKKKSTEMSHEDGIPTTAKSKRARRKQLHDAIKKTPPIYRTRQDLDFDHTLSSCYPGVAVLPRAAVSENVHKRYHDALMVLLRAGCFTQQVVSLMDKKWTLMRFTRLLIGKEGMTYMYNKVRCFAHPWQKHLPLKSRHVGMNPDGNDGIVTEYDAEVREALNQIFDINCMLEQHAELLCQQRGIETDTTTNAFNITVTNLMSPGDTVPEPYYGMGPQSVGWHRDLKLQPHSTIGVYSCHANSKDTEIKVPDRDAVEDDARSEQVVPWKIGLKVAWDVETPGLVLELQNGDSYFMLGECNTINQHCVLSGSEKRFSTTHRNGLVDGMTWEGIYKEYKAALDEGSISKRSKVGSDLVSWALKHIRKHIEVEDQWIRQFWVHGRTHAESHPYWHERMIMLENMWTQVEHFVRVQ